MDIKYLIIELSHLYLKISLDKLLTRNLVRILLEKIEKRKKRKVYFDKRKV
jgi:hypothetical protein